MIQTHVNRLQEVEIDYLPVKNLSTVLDNSNTNKII